MIFQSGKLRTSVIGSYLYTHTYLVRCCVHRHKYIRYEGFTVLQIKVEVETSRRPLYDGCFSLHRNTDDCNNGVVGAVIFKMQPAEISHCKTQKLLPDG